MPSKAPATRAARLRNDVSFSPLPKQRAVPDGVSAYGLAVRGGPEKTVCKTSTHALTRARPTCTTSLAARDERAFHETRGNPCGRAPPASPHRRGADGQRGDPATEREASTNMLPPTVPKRQIFGWDAPPRRDDPKSLRRAFAQNAVPDDEREAFALPRTRPAQRTAERTAPPAPSRGRRENADAATRISSMYLSPDPLFASSQVDRVGQSEEAGEPRGLVASVDGVGVGAGRVVV